MRVAIDIKTLRGVTDGVITIDAGYKNTGACQSAITFLRWRKRDITIQRVFNRGISRKSRLS